MSDTLDERLDRLTEIRAELESILQTLVLNDSTIIDALSQLLGALQQMQTRTAQTLDRLTEEVRTFGLELRDRSAHSNTAPPASIISRDDFASQNPEVGLLEYLYSFLSDTNAIDVGANVGLVSERLLSAGYTVYAFEPFPSAFDALEQKLSLNRNFHAFPCAIGAADGSGNLHIASDLTKDGKWDTALFHSLVKHPMLEDLQFSEVVFVPIRSLASLRQSGEIPQNAGILKIDTEGFDLEVIRGMGDARYPIVLAEFWDQAHPFGLSGNGKLEDLVAEMKSRGYPRHIVVYHVDETHTISYYCNRRDTVPKSWGNVIFFREHDLFSKALGWCEQVLRATWYR